MSLRWRTFVALLAIVVLLIAVAAVNVHTGARIRDRGAHLQAALVAGLPGGFPGAHLGSEARAFAASADEAGRLVLATGITGAAVALLVAFLLWRSIARPIGMLRQAAVDITAGRFDTRVTIHSLDDLGILGSTLNSMAEQLAISMQCIATLQARQNALQQALEDKELLLREVHHRVKNNLQVVSSLLDLQSRAIGERSMTELLEVSQNRIRCMALVHEQLYGTETYESIGTREYLNRLASHLVNCFGHPRSIRLRLELENVHLDVDRAMTVGLLANELLSNALKHAFPADRSGEVRMMLASHGDDCVLTVADDGVGMRPERRTESTGSLGMSLVRTLAKQLRGSVAIESLRGTCVRITFPMAVNG